jgi:GNAT superfamily N-acetyltransferase
METRAPASAVELERIHAFVRDIEDRASTRLVPFRWGTAVFNDDFPLSWAHNFVRLDRNLDGIEFDGLIAEVERLHARAGHAHRQVNLKDVAIAKRLRPDFEGLGWSVDRLLFMASHRRPDRPVDTSGVKEVDFDAVRPLLVQFLRTAPYGDSEETVRQLVERSLATASATEVRHFAVAVGGQIVSTCDLYSDGRTAQIEDVTTLENYRRRGFARATVARALQEARSQGHDLVFLVADDDDWPKELYGRLGFDPVGHSYSFTRSGHTGAAGSEHS